MTNSEFLRLYWVVCRLKRSNILFLCRADAGLIHFVDNGRPTVCILIHYGTNTKLLVNYKIKLLVKQLCLPTIISNVKNNKNDV